MIAGAGVRTVEIVGGGLAGLGLALGLRRVGVPVVLHEAGTYPRHRVCGEFITSLDQATITTLGLGPLLAPARQARSVTWFKDGHRQLQHRLPEPAICLSRFGLDDRMARAFVESGGELHTRHRADQTGAEGRVLAAGRRRQTSSEWIGIKAHFLYLNLQDALELHLGDQAYVGLTQIEDERVNVCGLFRRLPRSAGPVDKSSILFDQLRGAGLGELADRLGAATLDASSQCTVAGLDYRAQFQPDGAVHLGDQFGLIPPFTGNGMTVALQSARIAVEPLRQWTRGDVDWATTADTIHRAMQRELSPRIGRARRLHPWLLSPRRQNLLVKAAASHLIPTRMLYHLLH